jgi:hypothetical protein
MEKKKIFVNLFYGLFDDFERIHCSDNYASLDEAIAAKNIFEPFLYLKTIELDILPLGRYEYEDDESED